jgi:hypothetical protein
MRPRQRDRTIEAPLAPLRRRTLRRRDERQHHRGRHSLSRLRRVDLLTPANLGELEVGPQFAQAGTFRRQEAGLADGGQGFFRPARAAQTLDQSTHRAGVGGSLPHRFSQQRQALLDMPQLDGQQPGLAPAAHLMGGQLQRPPAGSPW